MRLRAGKPGRLHAYRGTARPTPKQGCEGIARRPGGRATEEPTNVVCVTRTRVTCDDQRHPGGAAELSDQTEVPTLTSRACGPLGPSSTSYSTFTPSSRLLKPSPPIALKWTNTSWPPSSCVMKP